MLVLLFALVPDVLTSNAGDLTPTSNAGKAVFVIWSLLAVPSLTILISNLGDTFVKWFTDLTNYIASGRS